DSGVAGGRLRSGEVAPGPGGPEVTVEVAAPARAGLLRLLRVGPAQQGGGGSRCGGSAGPGGVVAVDTAGPSRDGGVSGRHRRPGAAMTRRGAPDDLSAQIERPGGGGSLPPGRSFATR